MAKQKYALERGGPKRLQLSWRRGWKEFSVRLDGTEVGSAANRNELEAGQQFPLPDGSLLEVQLKARGRASILELLRDSKPLPGSATDPGRTLSVASGVVFFIGGLSILLALAGQLFEIAIIRQLYGWEGLIGGAMFLVLGFLVRRKFVIALGIAVALWTLNMVVGFFLSIQAGAFIFLPAKIIFQLTLLLLMTKGFGAIRELKKQ